jgi:hypothetical protein
MNAASSVDSLPFRALFRLSFAPLAILGWLVCLVAVAVYAGCVADVAAVLDVFLLFVFGGMPFFVMVSVYDQVALELE